MPDIGADEGLFVPYALGQLAAVFDSASRSITLSWPLTPVARWLTPPPGALPEAAPPAVSKGAFHLDDRANPLPDGPAELTQAPSVENIARGAAPESEEPAAGLVLTGYYIHRSVDSSSFVLLDSAGAAAVSYTDSALGSQSATYHYYLRARFDNGVSAPSETVSVFVPPTVGVDDPRALPAAYALLQNYPNPFNPSTKITYALPRASHVALTIYDILGREVVGLIDEVEAAGVHERTWDGRSDTGAGIGSGVYFVRFEARSLDGNGVHTSVAKMMLMK
jgi:hypothetical protein